MAVVPVTATNGIKLATSQPYIESKQVKETKALMSELCRHLYTLGWVSGTGGSLTLKVHDDSVPKQHQIIIMAPSGVQKERMDPDDMYVLSTNGLILSSSSPKPYPHKPPKCSDCAPVFMKAYELRNAGAVIHSHGMESCLVTMIDPLSTEFRIAHMEMIKGINGHGYHDELVVPIIENTAYERELTKSFAEAINAYPKSTAVLVRNHGIFIWGDSWINAKTQAECYHYLFAAALKLHGLGLNWSALNHSPVHRPVKGVSGGGKVNMSAMPETQKSYKMSGSSWRCVVLDIEGTTTPISFVTDVLFPYARDNVAKHLNATYETQQTEEDIKLLRCQVQRDLEQNVAGSVPIQPDTAVKENVISAVVENVEAMIRADRKITALKELQGHIWETGFKTNELKGVVYEDVPIALENWHSSGIKVYIYSSGSRLSQRLLFGNSNYGDLRKYLCGFFDTRIGNKKEIQSYVEITNSLGVDAPSYILFVTDVFQEAVAAKNAGLDVLISTRPGNAPLPENHGFGTIDSFSEI